jgi:hypothetical protein
VNRFDWSDEIIEQVKAILVRDLPAMLALIQADRADDLELDAPAPDNIWTADKVVPPSFPSIEIWGPDSARIHPDILHFQHRMAAVLTVVGSDEEVIDKQLRRTLLGILLVLDNQPLAADGVAAVIRCGIVNYTTVGTRQQDAGAPWVRSGSVEFVADTIND